MLRGIRAAVIGVGVALIASAVFAERPSSSRVRAIDVSDPGLQEPRVVSVPSAFPAPTAAGHPVVATLLTGEGYLLAEESGKPIWVNGELDGISGLTSQAGFAEVADDVVLTEGFDYHIEKIELVMAVLPVGELAGDLLIYDDCNGMPGSLLATFPATDIVEIGVNPNFPGLTFYRFVFADLGLFQPGGVRWWIVPQGASQGLYFWMTSGSGEIQGGQAKYRSAPYGFPNWTPVDQTGPNFGLCTDFNFRICGKACWKIHDNSPFSLSGFSSQGFPGGEIFLSNSFDNFQIPPGEGVAAICRLEFWMATNCDPNRVYVELYDNECDEPTGPPPVRIDRTNAGWRQPQQLFDAPDVPILVQGLPVYHFVVECPGIELRRGRNYWLTAALFWVGTPHDRALWLFGPRGGCGDQSLALGGGAEYRIEITEGRYRSDFIGIPYFAPISDVLNEDGTDVTLGGDREDMRDFAFRLWITEGSGQLLAGNPLFSIIGSAGWDGMMTPETPLPPPPPSPAPGGHQGGRP